MSRSRSSFSAKPLSRRIVIQCFLFIWYAGRIPGSPYSSMSSTWALFTLMISTFPFPRQPQLGLGHAHHDAVPFPVIRMSQYGIFRFLRPRVVRFRAECGLYVREQFVSGRHKRSHVRVRVLSLRMLVMGKTVNEDSTGANVFGEGETDASRLYKMGEGNFFQKNFPFPIFMPVQRGWGLLFHRRLGLFDLLLDECREIGGFLALEPGDPEGGVFVIVLQRLVKPTARCEATA